MMNARAARHFPGSRRSLGLLALAAWLVVPWAWWASRRAVPRMTTYLENPSGWLRMQGKTLVEDYDSEPDKVIVRELATGKTLLRLPWPKRDHPWPAYVSLQNGAILSAAVDQSGIQVRDVAAGREVSRISRDMSGCVQLSFSPDGTKLHIDHRDGTTEMWDVATGKLRFTLPSSATLYSRFAPDGRTLLSSKLIGDFVLIRDAETGRLRGKITEAKPGPWALSGDGRLLVLRASGTIALWDLTECRLLAQHSRGGQIVALSPTGDILALGKWTSRPPDMPRRMHWRLQQWVRKQYDPAHNSLELIDARTGKVLGSLPGADQIEFLPDGTLMTYDPGTHALAFWDVPPRTLLPWPAPWAVLGVAVWLSHAWWRARRSHWRKQPISPWTPEPIRGWLGGPIGYPGTH
jgi:WD40 repeat protein